MFASPRLPLISNTPSFLLTLYGTRSEQEEYGFARVGYGKTADAAVMMIEVLKDSNGRKWV
jgi:hypothetical protein